MYRTYVYLLDSSGVPVRFTSQNLKDYKTADALLEHIANEGTNVWSGDIERNVTGIGWTVCNHIEERNGEE